MSHLILATNVQVQTPFGPGRVQGQSDTYPPGWLVRVTINDSNRHALADRRCWTPSAKYEALFVFAEEDLR